MSDKPEQITTTDWPAAWAHLRTLDGDEWDAKADSLETRWKTDFVNAFVAYAMTRPGWIKNNAVEWAREAADDALMGNRDETPEAAAREEVHHAETETANAV